MSVDYAWALECWRDARARFLAGRPATPAPPQRVPNIEPAENGCWYDAERCTFPHCDCDNLSSEASIKG
jgi:hypothetical protein